MLVWQIILLIKYTTPQRFKGLIATFSTVILVSPVFSQTTQGINRESVANAVTCYKSSIKEPLTFYGNPMDAFTLHD